MATAKDLRRIALSLEGTSEAPHFERTAFKARRIYVTLAADGRSANFNFTPDQQALKCTVHDQAFRQIDNAFGRKGWTRAELAALTLDELRDALQLAWRNARRK